MKKIITLSLLLIPCFQQAHALRGANSFWQCASYDQSGKQWIAKNSFQRVALNKAFELCKRNSQEPGSCEVAQEFCEASINGHQTPKWQCSAFDKMAHVWKSDLYRYRNDAAIGAKLLCQNQSAFPGSCYVRLMTCHATKHY